MAANDYVLLNGPAGLDPGVVGLALIPTADGQLPIRLCNLSAAPVNLPQADWRFLAI